MPRKNKSTAPAAPRPLTGPQRLNKVLAAAGLGSRRDCEQLILDGRIEVDGNPVTDLATKVDVETAKITFDGSQLKTFRPVYYALHKPTGVLSTNRDPSGRMRAIDLVNVKERVFSVGRLDRFSEGLMLLTNDGELAQRLAHPRFGVQKLYLATVQGEVTQTDLEKLVRGVRLAEGFAKVDAVKLRRQRPGAAELEIALSEGKNREIRRILARLGHKVVGLKRLAIGPLRLGQLPVGGWRPLTREEVLALYSTTAQRKKRRGMARPPRGTPRDASETDNLAAGATVGQFHQPFDDEDDDDFGALPSFDDSSDDDFSIDEGDDDEIIALSDQSVVGTVIAYDDESDNESVVDEDSEGQQRSGGARRPRSGRADSRGRPSSRSSTAGAGGSRGGGRSGGSRSPHDLRNRQGRGGPAKPGSRSQATPEAEGFSWESAKPRSRGAGSTGPRSTGPRGAGSRAAGPRSAGPRAAGSRAGGPRAAGARSLGRKTAGTGGSRAAAARPATGRPSSGRPSAGRTGTGRTAAARPGAGRAGAGGRPGSSRPTQSRSRGPRAASGRPAGGTRSGGAKPGGAKPGGKRAPTGPKGKRGPGGASGGGRSGPRGRRK